MNILPAARLVNLYGPTECCIDSSTYTCTAEDATRAVVPIGRPVSNTRAYVLDPDLHPLPFGVAGELYIGGVQLARGYLNRPASTADRFVPDPLSGVPGARMYRSGDHVRMAADGTQHYLGRFDFQVKVRGFRIELGEIEVALQTHPAVVASVVAAQEDGRGDRRLVAYVVGDADAHALRTHLQQRLPEYMVPTAFVRLDELPLMRSGKIDRKALPAPDPATQVAQYIAPRTAVEEVLGGVWAEVLGLERVGVHDDFFALGGHSLLAMRLLSRVRAVVGAELSVRALFENPTIEGLARVLEQERAGAESPHSLLAAIDALTVEELDRLLESGLKSGAEE